MLDVAVIGAGLFGSVVAQAFRQEGCKVATFDNKLPGAGSPPAACLMRPSWFSSLGKEVYRPALDTLDKLYGVKQIPFKVSIGSIDVHWCDPAQILVPPDHVGDARLRGDKGSKKYVVTTGGQDFPAKLIVVAAGQWTQRLVPVEGGLVGQAGVAFLWPKKHVEQPFIQVWAPYRQITAFNRGDGAWCGDSNAIRAERWSEENRRASQERCVKATGFRTEPQQLFGVRPYSGMKPCYLKEAFPGVWVATGGAKNGTLAAGWCASELLKRGGVL